MIESLNKAQCPQAKRTDSCVHLCRRGSIGRHPLVSRAVNSHAAESTAASFEGDAVVIEVLESGPPAQGTRVDKSVPQFTDALSPAPF